MSPKITPEPVSPDDMEPQQATGAEQDPYGLDPLFTQQSSVRLTAFGSIAQSALADEEETQSPAAHDGVGPSQFSKAPPRLSYLQSMGSASSDQPLNETPGYVAMSSYPSAAIETPPSPAHSFDSK